MELIGWILVVYDVVKSRCSMDEVEKLGARESPEESSNARPSHEIATLDRKSDVETFEIFSIEVVCCNNYEIQENTRAITTILMQ